MKRLCCFLFATLLLAAAIAPTRAQESTARRLRFSEAIELSMGQTPQVQGARAGVDAAGFKASGTAAQRLPKLKADASVLRWDAPIAIQFGGGGGMMSAPVDVRAHVTTAFSLSLAQPISGLFVLGRLIDVDKRAVEIAETSVAKTRMDSAHRAAEAYVAVLNARASADLAARTALQFEAQHENAVALEKGGVLGHVDVLRLASARDAARLALVRAETSVAVAGAELAVAVNLAPEESLAVIDEFPEPPPAPTLGEAEATRSAASARLEIKDAALQTDQSRANKSVAMAQLLPNIMGVATYQNITGQGPFQPRNAWYIGATLSWELWDWQKTWKGVKEADARSVQVAATLETLRKQISLQVYQRLLETRAAFASLEPARSSLLAAEEAHRIQAVRFKQGVASTVDIINAETELYRARSAYSQTRYDYYRAQIVLARAIGALPFERGAGPRFVK